MGRILYQMILLLRGNSEGVRMILPAFAWKVTSNPWMLCAVRFCHTFAFFLRLAATVNWRILDFSVEVENPELSNGTFQNSHLRENWNFPSKMAVKPTPSSPENCTEKGTISAMSWKRELLYTTKNHPCWGGVKHGVRFVRGIRFRDLQGHELYWREVREGDFITVNLWVNWTHSHKNDMNL